MQTGQIVKLTNPQSPAEAAARYIVKEWNQDRGFITLICGMPIPPTETVHAADIVAVPAHAVDSEGSAYCHRCTLVYPGSVCGIEDTTDGQLCDICGEVIR